jgi:protein subunit release factor B
LKNPGGEPGDRRGVWLNDDLHAGAIVDCPTRWRERKVQIMPTPSEFHAARADRLVRLHLRLEDFEESFARSSGPGGQHVNKVSTAVTLRHLPSGAAVTVQDTRSQAINRHLAWTRLLDQIEERRRADRAARRAEAEKERRRKRPRPWGVKKRILEGKRHRGETKRQRRTLD